MEERNYYIVEGFEPKVFSANLSEKYKIKLELAMINERTGMELKLKQVAGRYPYGEKEEKEEA